MPDTRDAAPLSDWLEHLATSGFPVLASLAKAIGEGQREGPLSFRTGIQ
ncbi:hypothetical protein AB0E08_48455 [Streptomyces sp. NPDC048281]